VLEFILAIGASIGISRFAEADRSGGLKWGAITFGLCLLSFLIPLPFLRIFIAVGVAFGLMIFGKKTFY